MPTVTPQRIMQYAWGYAPPLVLEAGVRLGVFDALAAGPRTVPEVVATTGASERGLTNLLDALVGLELLAKDGSGRYRLVPESEEFLVSGRPGYLGGFLKHASSQMIPRWLHLADAVKSGKPVKAVNQEVEGSAFFEQFVEDLYPMNRPAASALADHLELGGEGGPASVLDLAAGAGVWGFTLAERSPAVRVTCVDWATVLNVTRRTAERLGLADRCEFVAGDLLTADFGAGHGVAILGHILHSEGADRSRRLLRRTFDALAPGGTAVIAEYLVNADRTGPVRGLVFALNMLVNTDAGDAFSEEEIGSWLGECGFVNVRTLEVPGPSPLILADRPQ